jgi:putative peptidoglycan lipid II flippase
MLVSFFAIGLNVTLNLQLTFRFGMGHRGLALSTGLAAVANFLLLFLLMRRAAGGMQTGVVVASFARMVVAGAGLAGVCWAGHILLAPWLQSVHLAARATALFAVIGVGSAIYFALCALLRVEEAQDAVALLRRKISRA